MCKVCLRVFGLNNFAKMRRKLTRHVMSFVVNRFSVTKLFRSGTLNRSRVATHFVVVVGVVVFLLLLLGATSS